VSTWATVSTDEDFLVNGASVRLTSRRLLRASRDNRFGRIWEALRLDGDVVGSGRGNAGGGPTRRRNPSPLVTVVSVKLPPGFYNRDVAPTHGGAIPGVTVP